MKFQVSIQAAIRYDYEVEAEDEVEAEEKAMELAKEEFKTDGIDEPEFEVDSIMEITEDGEI